MKRNLFFPPPHWVDWVARSITAYWTRLNPGWWVSARLLLLKFQTGRWEQTTAESRLWDEWERPTGGHGHLCDQEENLVSAPGQSACDRGAPVLLWLDTSDRWLTAGRPCLAVRSGSWAQWELCAADITHYIKSCLIPRLRGIATLLWSSSLPLWPLHQVTDDNTNEERERSKDRKTHTDQNLSPLIYMFQALMEDPECFRSAQCRKSKVFIHEQQQQTTLHLAVL